VILVDEPFPVDVREGPICDWGNGNNLEREGPPCDRISTKELVRTGHEDVLIAYLCELHAKEFYEAGRRSLRIGAQDVPVTIIGE
jgi:hypothetical protein